MLIVSQFLMEIRVSTMDPTPSVPTPSSTQFKKKLSSFYVRMTKTNSHQKFVSICLLEHLIPKGLQLKIQPCVSKSLCRELASHLQNDWTWIIKRTCRDFLTTLKLFHRGCAYHIKRQADDLEASIEARFGRTNEVDEKRSQKRLCQPEFPRPGMAL